MYKNFIISCMVIGILASGVCSDVLAMNQTEQSAENQQIQERILTYEDAEKLIAEMKARGSTELAIPYGFTSIGNRAFFYCTELTSVTIPNSVTSIGKEAFNRCRGLKSITIPNSVTSIGNSAFEECTDLKSIDIQNGVIGDRMFYECTRLESVTIHDSVTSIGNQAFEECTKLTSVTIPNSVGSIGKHAFYGCTKLTSITIPNSVISIGGNVFLGCYEAEFIVASELMKNYLSSAHKINASRITVDAALYTPENAWKWPEDGHIQIPKNIKAIYDGMFSNRSDIKSVIIPESVTEIGKRAFQSCTGLRYVTILNSVASINEGAFDACNDANFIVASEAMRNYILLSRSNIGYNRIIVDTDLYTPENASWKWPEDGHVKIPANIKAISNRMFLSRNDIKTITIPNSVTSIDDFAFNRCRRLKSITIPNSVTSIGKNAFEGCTELTSITIPNSVTSIIGFWEFWECKKAQFIVASEAMKNYISSEHGIDGGRITVDAALYTPENAWKWPEDGHIQIPENIKVISDKMFWRRRDIKSVTIPNSVTSIGACAFYRCTGLESITIPDRVTSIGTCAFYGCTGLESITIPDSVTVIGDSAFHRCDNLKHIYVYSDRVRDLVVQNRGCFFFGGNLFFGDDYIIDSSIVEVIKK